MRIVGVFGDLHRQARVKAALNRYHHGIVFCPAAEVVWLDGAAKPALVIVDAGHGIEVVRSVRRALPGVRLLALLPAGKDPSRYDGLVDAVLHEPFDSAGLRAAVEKLVPPE